MTAADSKQTGTTPTERFLASLCERSFLGLWCYPNVFRDQGKTGSGDGKEVCDVLVAFREHLILFSDKNCAFPDGEISLAWRRWYKRAVYEAAKQLYGAERWITKYPDRIYLDSQCTQRLPIDLPMPGQARVHRIVVAQGAGRACLAHVGGTSGSLMLCPKMRAPVDAIPSSDGLGPEPFVIGQSPGSFFHVLDDVTLPVVLRELDTIADLVDYLSWKEAFIQSGHLGFSAGEEHLVAYYLECLHTGLDPSVPLMEGRITGLDETFGPSVRSSTWYIEERERLRPSYAWDRMVQMLAEDILAERMTPLFGDVETVAVHERRSRALASAPRRVRLDLAMSFREVLQTDLGTRFRLVRHPLQWDTLYLFLVLARGSIPQLEYRKIRAKMLQVYAAVHGSRNPDVQHVVGICTGPASSGDDLSHEVVYIDRAHWSPEHERLAADAERLLGPEGYFK